MATTSSFLFCEPPSSDPSDAKRYQDGILDALAGHAFFQIMEWAFYIKISYGAEFDEIVDKLGDLASVGAGYEAGEAVPDDEPSLRFVMTPPTVSVAYNGWLEEQTWNRINRMSM